MAGKSRAFAQMLRDLIHDFGDPGIVWQIAALAGALLVSFGVARWLSARLQRHYASVPPARRAGASSLLRSMFPLVGWAVVGLVRLGLSDRIHTSLLAVAQVPLLGIGVIYLAFYLLRRLFSQSAQASGMLHLIERFVVVFAWGGMIIYVLGVQGDLFRWLSDIRLAVGRNSLSLLTLITGALWVCGTVLLALWASAVLEDRIMRARAVDANLKVVLSRLAKALLLVVALLVSLSLVGIDITVLGVFCGALGVGLGFGLQKIASNYVSGFIILLDRSLRIGDLVTINSYHGTVSQIRTRYTVVRGLDGVEVIVPNEKLISDVVQNHSFTETRGLAKVAVQIAYSADVEQAMQLMLAAVQDVDRVLSDPAPWAALSGFGADGMNLEMGFWVRDPALGTLGIRSKVNLKIWQSFRENGIEIPYAQREIRILNDWPATPPASAGARVERDPRQNSGDGA